MATTSHVSRVKVDHKSQEIQDTDIDVCMCRCHRTEIDSRQKKVLMACHYTENDIQKVCHGIR